MPKNHSKEFQRSLSGISIQCSSHLGEFYNILNFKIRALSPIWGFEGVAQVSLERSARGISEINSLFGVRVWGGEPWEWDTYYSK